MRTLTGEQELAVARREGSLALAAGAGSGKTSVLVERFVRAVREDGVAPGRILAITFTERAAGELRERVRARLLELGERDALRAAEAANVCTFHSFCARLLRAHPLAAEVEPGFEILDEDFAGRLRALAFGDALAGLLDGERPAAVDLVAAYGADPLRSMVLGAYAQLRSHGQSDPRLPDVEADGQHDEKAVRACESIDELLRRFGDAYARRKHARAALDFDDLELNARALLERRSDVRQTWAERLQLLMVDEFQDTNPRQLQILAALDRDNLFTVGDQLQSIYGFRHADVGLFRERHARLAERDASLRLTCNFRSRPAILAAVERLFAERMGERFAPLAAGLSGEDREPLLELLLCDKRGWEGMPIDDAMEGLPDATPWRQAEARLLAARIVELVDEGHARAGEIVVLLRALGDLPVYETALRARGLRTVAEVGGFWGHQQVGDLLAWLRALANPGDELSLYSTLASPLVGISSDGLALIASAARGRRGGVWRAIEELPAELGMALSEADRPRLEAFRQLFAAERTAMALHPISELLRRAIDATGYDAHVLSLSWGGRRLANVHKLVRLAQRYEAGEGRDLRGFLDHVDHVELGREADAPVGDGELDAVRLMSIHAAKGLEFPVVCVADLGREPNLRTPDLLVDPASGRVGLRLLDLGDPEPVSALDYDELREQRRAAEEEEEDRVLYVACTRAENRLLLSGAVAFDRWPALRPGVAPIAWLAPALVADIANLATPELRPEGALTVDAGGGLLVRCLLSAPPTLHTVPAEQAVHAPDTEHDRRAQQAIRAAHTAHDGPERAHGTEPEILVSVGPSKLKREAEQARELGSNGAISLPLPLEDPDATMSYTSLSELERCGYRYYLERVLHLPEDRAAARGDELDREDGGVEARVRGTIVHALLESVDFARPRPPSVEDVARAARRLGARVDRTAREEIAALIASALDAAPARELRAEHDAHSEYPFAFSLAPAHPEEPLVTGVFDLIVRRPDGSCLIVDYKSDRLDGGEDLEQLVERDYGFQRLLYALAAIEDGAREVEVAHWFLESPQEWVSARFVCNERDRLRERLCARLERVRTRGFVVTDSPHRGICLTCPGRAGLCSWGETRTMSERSPTLEFST